MATGTSTQMSESDTHTVILTAGSTHWEVKNGQRGQLRSYCNDPWERSHRLDYSVSCRSREKESVYSEGRAVSQTWKWAGEKEARLTPKSEEIEQWEKIQKSTGRATLKEVIFIQNDTNECTGHLLK